ncbi:hypothetical protein FKM82_023248 [Ascaphus truei]
MLCDRWDDCPEKYGEKKTYHEHGLTVHYYCVLMSSGIWQRGEEDEGIYGFLVEDIKEEVKRARKLRCILCKMKGASIGCVGPRCKRSFHFPCGVEGECIFQFTENFASYCWDHRPVQNILPSHGHGSSPCIICLDYVTHVPSYHVVRSPCCKTAWFHRNCLQYQALSAGLFFFRCSVCNNKKKFQSEMLRIGIHIPERDASWELEENAYQDLLVRYQRCDVQKCLCQRGRECNSPNGKWEVMLCQCCGSSGTHRACSSLQQLKENWECSECSSIMYTPVNHKRSRPASLAPSDRIRCEQFGMEQQSPKCPRMSQSPGSKVPLRQILTPHRPVSNILRELQLQIDPSLTCVLRVWRTNLWRSSLKAFRKRSFCPSNILRVKFVVGKRRRVVSVAPDGSKAEYFGLLLRTIQDSTLLEGSEYKNLSLNLEALQDNLYYEAGRMVAVALVHGGPAPGFFSQTLFSCLIHEPQYVKPVLEDVADPDVAQAIVKIRSSTKLQMLRSAVIHYFDYLSETGSLRLTNFLSDKLLLVNDMLAYHVIHRVQAPLESFKQGLKTLGVLEKIQAHPSAFWSVLCLRPEKLTAKALGNLFSVSYPADLSSAQQSLAASCWADYLEDSEEGMTVFSLEDLLSFATGLDSIPPAGCEPQPSIHFQYGVLPLAQKCTNCLELPVPLSYAAFKKTMEQAIADSLGKA